MRLLVVVVFAAACGSKAPAPVAKPAPPPPAATPAPSAPEDDLVRAVREMNEDDPRSVDAAMMAADALGEQHRGLDALERLAVGHFSTKGLPAQIAAIRALGRFEGNAAVAEDALLPLLVREGPPRPENWAPPAEPGDLSAPDPAGDDYNVYLAVTGAAINAACVLHVPRLVGPLVEAMYRTPELFAQARGALIESGPTADTALRQVLRGENRDIETLFAERKLDRACSTPQTCHPVSAKEFYAALVLGHFHDPAAIPDLLAVLKQPPLPAFYLGDEASGSTQYDAVFDALRRIGEPAAAAPVRAIWMDAKLPAQTRALAANAYPFVARDTIGVAELGKIAADNAADDQLRQEAATAYARLANDVKDLELLEELAQRYLDASAEKAKQAAPLRKAADAADRDLAPVKDAVKKAKTEALRVTKDASATVDQIKAATEAAKRAEAAYRAALKKHKARIMPFRELDTAAKAYLGYARMFQIHMARIEVAARCKADAGCLAAALATTGDVEAAKLAPYIKDLASWTPDEKQGLASAAIERAAIELGKLGEKASDHTGALLDAVATSDTLVRGAILLALPHVAKLPCPACAAKLDALVRADQGHPELERARTETAALRNYFHWAGKKP